MESTATRQQTSDTAALPLWRRVWPAALGLLVAVLTAYGLADGREVAPVVAASGFVYLAAGALGRSDAAWPAFGVTFVLITLAKVLGLDAVAVQLAFAAVLMVIGLAARRTKPWWAFPLQALAMGVLGVIAVVAMRADATVGGLLVASALLAHAGWDLHHHHTNRVVDRPFAMFCGVLDVVVAAFVAAITLTA